MSRAHPLGLCFLPHRVETACWRSGSKITWFGKSCVHNTLNSDFFTLNGDLLPCTDSGAGACREEERGSPDKCRAQSSQEHPSPRQATPLKYLAYQAEIQPLIHLINGKREGQRARRGTYNLMTLLQSAESRCYNLQLNFSPSMAPI